MTIHMDRSLALRVVAGASRAPSPHNCQPARWRVGPSGVRLYEDSARWLSAGDPGGRDSQIALGMAWEAMQLALGEHGIALGEPMREAVPYPPSRHDVRLVASADICAHNGAADPLAALQSRRACERGRFEPMSAQMRAALDALVDRYAHVVRPVPQQAWPALAGLYDKGATELLADQAITAELMHWLRLRPAQLQTACDGMTAADLRLNRLEAFAASRLLQPAIASRMVALGLGGVLVSDASKVRSAGMLVAIHGDNPLDAFATGRAWYRFWLALTAIGCAAVPMSALLDAPRTQPQARALLGLGGNRTAVNVMRIGPARAHVHPGSARLPADAVLLTE